MKLICQIITLKVEETMLTFRYLEYNKMLLLDIIALKLSFAGCAIGSVIISAFNVDDCVFAAD